MSPRPEPRWVTTDADIAELSWHDALVHGLLLVPEAAELLLDLDWSIEWLPPEDGGIYFRAWTAPVTLVFHGVTHVHGDLSLPHDGTLIDISPDESPSAVSGGHNLADLKWWLIKGVVGHLTIAATGFTQYARRPPALVTGGRLALADRGGVSFLKGRDASVVA